MKICIHSLQLMDLFRWIDTSVAWEILTPCKSRSYWHVSFTTHPALYGDGRAGTLQNCKLQIANCLYFFYQAQSQLSHNSISFKGTIVCIKYILKRKKLIYNLKRDNILWKTYCWKGQNMPKTIPLKLPSLFAVRFFWTFHNKLHNMKPFVILSHHDHHFSHLLVFMKKN